MNSVHANQLSDEFEAAFSEILPDLYQLLQAHQVTGIFNLYLLDQDRSPTTAVPIKPSCCSYVDPVTGLPKCRKCKTQNQDLSVDDIGGINSESLEHLCNGIESILSTSERLTALGRPRASQPDENFEVYLLIDMATANPNSEVVSQWVNNALQCSIP